MNFFVVCIHFSSLCRFILPAPVSITLLPQSDLRVAVPWSPFIYINSTFAVEVWPGESAN
jgi:hypothetical protein